MVLKKELEIAGGKLIYEVDRAGAHILEFAGLAGEVRIPETIEESPVVSIEKKAFLSKKNLRKVWVPESVETVGDWAFGYCDGLQSIAFGNRDVYFGKAVFLECGALSELCLGEMDGAVSHLLAAAVTQAAAPYLLNPAELGTAEWLEKWDSRMLTILHTADEEGYSKQVLCGEEDYGSTDFAAYVSNQRKKKIRLLLLRCLYPVGMKENCAAEIKQYLLEHTAGCPEDETWQVILQEHGNDREYYELFAGLGCITKENFDGMLFDVGEEFPELRAFLMRYKEEKLGYGDFFGGLVL